MNIKVITSFSVILSLCLFIVYSEAAIAPEKIVGIWLLDEVEGNAVQDVSENGRDGTATQSDWVAGKVDGALRTNKGGTVTIPLGQGIIRDKMSFILWLQFTDVATQQNYFSIWDQSNNRYVPYKDPGHVLRSWTNNWNISSGVVVKAGEWYHVANIYDGNTAKIYVNGEEKISQAVPKFQLLDQEQTAWFSTDRGTGFLSATIMDEVGLFNDALSEEEIQNIMEDGIYKVALSVEPNDKLPIVWGELKQK